MSQYDSKKRRFVVEYRWQRDDSIFRSICLPFVTISHHQHRFNPFERANDWILKDFSYQLEQAETLSRSCVSMCYALFSQTYKRKIYVKIRTKQSFIHALSTPIARQRSAISSSYIFLCYRGIKVDTFAWPSFSLWTKKVPVVMSEFPTPRAERSQRNRYADATFYFSKRIAFGFSGFMEQRKMPPFCYELLLKLTIHNLSYNEYAIHFKYMIRIFIFISIFHIHFFYKKV